MVQILFCPISLISPLRVFLLVVTEKGSSFTLDQSSHSLLFVGFFFFRSFFFLSYTSSQFSALGSYQVACFPTSTISVFCCPLPKDICHQIDLVVSRPSTVVVFTFSIMHNRSKNVDFVHVCFALGHHRLTEFVFAVL